MLLSQKKQEIIFIRQFRSVINGWTLELPAGAIDEGEDKKEAASRELLEESGYRCEDLEYVASARVAVDRINSLMHIFFGRNAVRSDEFSSENSVEVRPMSFADLKKCVIAGECQHVSGLGLWQMHWENSAELYIL